MGIVNPNKQWAVIYDTSMTSGRSMCTRYVWCGVATAYSAVVEL